MKLNYELTQPESGQSEGNIILIHGLFGSLSNLGMLARALQERYQTIQIDLRNHGLSGQSAQHDYVHMAQDVIETLNDIGIDQFSVIGHSMGGKVAMKLTELAPQRLQGLIILDMAPVAYGQRHHDTIFKALLAVQDAHLETRKEAIDLMRNHIKEEGVIQFLLKSFQQGHWKFNVKALYENYSNVIDWEKIQLWTKPVLFIRGSNSEYIEKQEYIDAIQQQFSNAEILTLKDAGHWLHAEKTKEVIELIENYLKNKVYI